MREVRVPGPFDRPLLSDRALLRLIGLLSAFALAGVATAHAQCVFRVDMIDVGQGDATLVQTPDCHAALIDGGDLGMGVRVREQLATRGITALDAVFVTHYHQDHLAGIVEIAKAPAIPVGTAYDRGGSYSSATYTSYASLYSGRRVAPTVGQVIALGSSVTFTVIARDTATSTEDNRALGLRVTYGEIDLVVAGDLLEVAEPKVAGNLSPVEIYKANHHGSSTSSTDLLMAVLEPTLSTISVGASNSYGHPGLDAIDRMDNWGKVLLTENPTTGARLGTISITSTDGLTYQASQGSWTGTYTARADAASQRKAPSSVSVVTGTATGTATSVSTSNTSSYVVTAGAVSGGYQVAWQAKATLTTAPSRLTVAWYGKGGVATTEHLQLLNPSTQAWVDVGYHPVATTIAGQYHVILNPGTWRDASGVVQARLVSDVRATAFTVSTDVLWFVWEP